MNKITIKDIKLKELQKVTNESELKQIYPRAKIVQVKTYKIYYEIQSDVFIRCDLFLKDGTPMVELMAWNSDDIDFNKFEITYIYKTKDKFENTYTDLWRKNNLWHTTPT